MKSDRLLSKLHSLSERKYLLPVLLFLCSFAIYSFYFYPIFFNLNAILSSITSDSLKNYFTFVYHIKNDTGMLHFSGMNYPYGEHIIYTDCQPILTFILRLFPFTHNHLIGILHGLMFFSFIITPSLLFRIFKIMEIDRLNSFFLSLAVALLSPQFLKINAGHFALAYGCLIPISILLILRAIKYGARKNFWNLFLFNCLLFLLHPYMGFGLSLFSFFALTLFECITIDKKTFLKNILLHISSGILPLALFKGFMLLTDSHTQRTTEPYGSEVMVENLDSVLAPVFGPFQGVMESFLHNRTGHYEGHTYLGFFTILVSILLLLSIPFLYRKLKVRREVLVVFAASLLFLFIAFGYHLKVLAYLNISSSGLNQFRAVCRFAWIFYFTLPLFLISVVYHSLKENVGLKTFRISTLLFSLLFFVFHLSEARAYFVLDEHVFWKYRNFFNENHLNEEELKVLSDMKKKAPQAILTLPMFHGGSEMYERAGSNNSMIPAMIYSYHTGIPIAGVLMSRTSITETKNLIEIFNGYKKQRPLTSLLTQQDFFVLTTHDALFPDESRILGEIKQFGNNDSLGYGYIPLNNLLKRKITEKTDTLWAGNVQNDFIYGNGVYIASQNRKPFLEASIKDYETIYTLDSNAIHSGTYVVSFHYHYSENTYRELACDLIVTRNTEWEHNIPVRRLSGFYPGFAIFEQSLILDKKNKYEFIIKGPLDKPYHVSNFLLRPENETVIIITPAQDTLINNFPLSN